MYCNELFWSTRFICSVFVIDKKQASKCSTAALMLPTNEDALRQLATLGNDEFQEGIFLVNKPCVNICIVNGKLTRHIGYFRKMRSAKMYEVEEHCCGLKTTVI